MIDNMAIYQIIKEDSGTEFHGNEIEYFIDDTNDIGEVYLDGNLLYQSTSIYHENDLIKKFHEAFSIVKQESLNA